MSNNLQGRANQELLSTLTTEERDRHKDNYNSELIKKTDVAGTPFTIITKENKSFLTLGQYRISDYFSDEQAVRIELSENIWNIVINLITLLISVQHNLQEEKKNQLTMPFNEK